MSELGEGDDAWASAFLLTNRERKALIGERRRRLFGRNWRVLHVRYYLMLRARNAEVQLEVTCIRQLFVNHASGQLSLCHRKPLSAAHLCSTRCMTAGISSPGFRSTGAACSSCIPVRVCASPLRQDPSPEGRWSLGRLPSQAPDTVQAASSLEATGARRETGDDTHGTPCPATMGGPGSVSGCTHHAVLHIC